MNTPCALILTDATHAPTVIGHYNTRQAIDEMRCAIRNYFTDDAPFLRMDILPGTALVLDECRAAIKAHPNHFVNLRSLPLNDPYRIQQPESHQYAVTFYIPGTRCVTYFTAMSEMVAERIVNRTINGVKNVVAFCIPADHPEYKGIFADREEIPAADLDRFAF